MYLYVINFRLHERVPTFLLPRVRRVGVLILIIRTRVQREKPIVFMPVQQRVNFPPTENPRRRDISTLAHVGMFHSSRHSSCHYRAQLCGLTACRHRIVALKCRIYFVTRRAARSDIILASNRDAGFHIRAHRNSDKFVDDHFLCATGTFREAVCERARIRTRGINSIRKRPTVFRAIVTYLTHAAPCKCVCNYIYRDYIALTFPKYIARSIWRRVIS